MASSHHGVREKMVGLVEDMVSRHHAKLELSAGQVLLTDLSSTNGTFVNGERITSIRLRDGDQVTVGRTPIVFHAGRR